jgi:Uma2 family endonuclease
MIGALRKPTRMTVSEYLALEEASEARNEYVGGIAYPIDAAPIDRSEEHAIIQLNVAGALSAALAEDLVVLTGVSKLGAHVSMPGVEETRAVVHADVLVCGAAAERIRGICTNPLLIVDVLTPATERTDRFRKPLIYSQHASLSEYVFVCGHTPIIELYRRRNDWSMEIFGIGDSIRLESFDLTLTAQQIYRRVRF